MEILKAKETVTKVEESLPALADEERTKSLERERVARRETLETP